MWLAYLVPWLASRSDHEELADPNSARFADSVRILTADVADASPDLASVSTPLIRKAQLGELRLIARTAAKRRLRTLFVLLAAATVLAVLAAVHVVAWWTIAIPVGLIVAFLGIARFSVVAMHNRLDEQAARVVACREEDTDIIVLADDEASVRLDLSVDLASPDASHGSLWDPIPVTSPTYVSQPLVPRTVRTIDLSAPAEHGELVVPTADALDADTQAIEVDYGVRRAVNE